MDGRKRAPCRGLATALVVCAVALTLGGCGILDSGSDGAAADLTRARRLWATSGMADYDLVLERLCFCQPLGTVTVEVRAGVRTASWVETDDGPMPLSADLVPWYPTVAGLFTMVDEAITTGVAQLRVTYHPVLGYPVDLWVDRSTSIGDEEFGYEATLHAPGVSMR